MTDFRSIPSIEQLRRDDAVRALEARFGRAATLDALRSEAAALRHELANGRTAADRTTTVRTLVRGAEARLAADHRASLRPVINATGVVIHTNLGRAPLARAAIERIAAIGAGYANLEYDLATGSRGQRDRHAEALLCRLTGAGAAAVVNNNAAAALLVLAALAWSREVIVSRGELVEIGGGFRVPDVMTQSGARLREIGTTNRTRAADYAAAIGDDTALLLRVHPSNFEMRGFTERPSLEEVIAVGRRHGVPVAEDLGSGNLIPDRTPGIAGSTPEPTVQASVAAGVDVVFFSGDKLLGGPQAGVILGRDALIDRIRRHPLMRALRVDKLTYAALEATLLEYAAGRAAQNVPVGFMLSLTADAIGARARALAARLTCPGRMRATVTDGVSAVGGGSAPGVEMPTCLIALDVEGLTAHTLTARLRTLDPPVIARIEQDRVLLDLRTVLPEQDAQLADLLAGLQT